MRNDASNTSSSSTDVTVADYGSWSSPFSASDLAGRNVALKQLRLDGRRTYWVENRASQGGRSVLLQRIGSGPAREILPMTHEQKMIDVRNRVHEYGGKSYAVEGDLLVVADGDDGRVYRLDMREDGTAIGRLKPLTPPLGDVRYADFHIDLTRDRVIAIREDHRADHRDREGHPTNDLVAIPLNGEAAREESAIVQLMDGWDFLAHPRTSPDGAHLAFLTWNHPAMPWTDVQLRVAPILDDGTAGEPVVIGGGDGRDIACAEPTWTPAGELIHVNDSTGWYNLYRTEGFPSAIDASLTDPNWAQALRTRPLHPAEVDFHRPSFQLGSHTFDILDEDHLLVSWSEEGVWKLGSMRISNGELEPWPTEWIPVGNVAASGSRAVFVGATADQAAAVVQIRDGEEKILRRSADQLIRAENISHPRTLSWPVGEGGRAHGFFYPPTNAAYAGPEGSAPPLIVHAHGGPSAQVTPTLDPVIQYWTTRGFAYLDVNYRGSVGYGRAYLDALNGEWGIADVEDCVGGVTHLASAGEIDPARVAITGGSAGGYTVLMALTSTDVFTAGSSRYGIGDLQALVRDTHKFESHYPELLIGPYPEQAALYEQRSPINRVENLHTPVILLQGGKDAIVPPNQAESFAAALREKGLEVELIIFPEEGHGFRAAESIIAAAEAELNFFRTTWGITEA